MRAAVIVAFACGGGEVGERPTPVGSAKPAAPVDAGRGSAAVKPTRAPDPGPLRILEMRVGSVVLSDGRIRWWGGPTTTAREIKTFPGARSMVSGLVILDDGSVIDTRWENGAVTSSSPRKDLVNVARIARDRTGSTKWIVHTDGRLSVVDRGRYRKPEHAKAEDAIIASQTNVVEAVAGDCILDKAGTVSCLRAKGYEPVKGMPASRHLVDFWGHICGLATTGGVHCFHHWSTRIYEVPGFEKATAIAADVSFFASKAQGLLCGIVEHGEVICSTLGEQPKEKRTLDPRIDPPVRVPNITGATRIDVAVATACAETPKGVACWGDNGNGQVGDGTRIDRTEPAIVENLLADTLPPPRDGYDALPESSTKMSWAGLPAACKKPTTFAYPAKPIVTFDLASAYAWWNHDKSLVVRIASYHTEPARVVDEPRGNQSYANLVFERFDKNRGHVKSDRGHYVLDVEGPRELAFSYRNHSSSSKSMRGSQEADLRYLDATWACGTFQFEDKGATITSTWAARLLPDKS